MTVTLTPALERFIHRRVAVGTYESPSDVVRAGLRLLGEHEEQTLLTSEELRQAVAVGRAALDAGEVVDGPAFVARMRRRIATVREKETRRRRAG